MVVKEFELSVADGVLLSMARSRSMGPRLRASPSLPCCNLSRPLASISLTRLSLVDFV